MPTRPRGEHVAGHRGEPKRKAKRQHGHGASTSQGTGGQSEKREGNTATGRARPRAQGGQRKCAVGGVCCEKRQSEHGKQTAGDRPTNRASEKSTATYPAPPPFGAFCSDGATAALAPQGLFVPSHNLHTRTEDKNRPPSNCERKNSIYNAVSCALWSGLSEQNTNLSEGPLLTPVSPANLPWTCVVDSQDQDPAHKVLSG